MSRRRIHVSDHAVLRYLERVRGVDLALVRRTIARAVANGVERDACGVIRDGLTYKLAGTTVVTVFRTGAGPDHRTGGARRAGGDGDRDGDGDR